MFDCSNHKQYAIYMKRDVERHGGASYWGRSIFCQQKNLVDAYLELEESLAATLAAADTFGGRGEDVAFSFGPNPIPYTNVECEAKYKVRICK